MMAPGPSPPASAADRTWRESPGARRRLLRELIAAQKAACKWCGCHLLVGGRARRRRDRRVATIDHVVPPSRGGTDARGNLCAACAECNNGRGALTVEEWLAVTRDGLAIGDGP